MKTIHTNIFFGALGTNRLIWQGKPGPEAIASAEKVVEKSYLTLMTEYQNWLKEFSGKRDDLAFRISEKVSKRPSDIGSGLLNTLVTTEPYKSHKEIRIAVAMNENTTSDTLIKLANDTEGSVKASVAEHKNTPLEWKIKILAGLAKSGNQIDRWYAAANPNTPEDLRLELQKDEVEAVREEAKAKTHEISEPVVIRFLTKCGNDTSDSEARLYAASNLMTPTDILEKLKEDEVALVKSTAITSIQRQNIIPGSGA